MANTSSAPRLNIKRVIVEFRFPLLLELGESEVPKRFWAGIRKSFPFYEKGFQIDTDSHEGNAKTYFHTFRDEKNRFAVSLHQNSLVIETVAVYPGSQAITEVAQIVVKSLIEVIDSDLFLRVGVRFIGSIEGDRSSLAENVNKDLVASVIGADVPGSVVEASGRVMFIDGQQIISLLNHGAQYIGEEENSLKEKIGYAIDVDSGKDLVATNEWHVWLSNLFERDTQLLMWAMGDALKASFVKTGD